MCDNGHKNVSDNFFKIFFNAYLFLRQRQSVNGGGSEKEGDTESETGSRLWAVSTKPDMGLKPTDHEIMTWAEVRGLSNWATQAPQGLYFLNIFEVDLFCPFLLPLPWFRPPFLKWQITGVSWIVTGMTFQKYKSEYDNFLPVIPVTFPWPPITYTIKNMHTLESLQYDSLASSFISYTVI